MAVKLETISQFLFLKQLLDVDSFSIFKVRTEIAFYFILSNYISQNTFISDIKKIKT